MHVVLGLLGSIVTILWLLHRLAEMGIDLGGLNPWLWNRRRKWKKTYNANPVFSIDSPMEVTALLVTAIAKIDGDMSSDEKKEILEIFEQEFHLSKRDAAGLLVSSTHLLGRGDEVNDSLKSIISPSIKNFSLDQAESAIAIFRRIANLDGGATELKMELIERISEYLQPVIEPNRKWQ